MRRVREEWDEDILSLSISQVAIDLYEYLPDRATVWLWKERGSGEILTVRGLEDLRELIDVALERMHR